MLIDQIDQQRCFMAANPSPTLSAQANQPVQVNLYEAKTHLSSLVERAAKGEEIVIAKAGKPMAKLISVAADDKALKPLRKFGQNLLGITFLSDDWEKDIPLSYFQDEGKENPFGDEPFAEEPL
jgi:prevent-host-death family protein